MRFLGVDPDTRGAWAVLEDGRVKVVDAPVVRRGARRRLDEGTIATALYLAHRSDGPIAFSLLEATPALPARMGGLFANHSRGAGGACYRTALAAAGISYEEVQAAAWKRRLGLVGANHAGLCAAARRLFPSDAHLFVHARDHGRAAAALLAEAARRRWNGRDR